MRTTRNVVLFDITVPWQFAHVAPVTPIGCGRAVFAAKEFRWHVPHASWVLFTVVHAGTFSDPPRRLVPWQYVLVHVYAVVLHTGVSPPVFASVPNVISAGLVVSTWPVTSMPAGTRWHWLHATADEMFDEPSRCGWCAPTPRTDVAVLSVRSTGGAWSGGLLALPAALP
jgi:hypothetical protein